jgi:hypothetical protein
MMTLDTRLQGSLATLTERRRSRAEFQSLGDMPPELEWFSNLDNPRTRGAAHVSNLTVYATPLGDFEWCRLPHQ